jgi:hypothetical protein
MEADWDIEIFPEAPALVIPWEGFIDLRHGPGAELHLIPEAAGHPPLREALVRLNSKESGSFTSKCDLWWLGQEEIDKDEFGSESENTRFGFASYIDVLFDDTEKFWSFEFHEALVRRLTGALKTLDLADSRVDLVVRPATINSSPGYGMTIYTAGCGNTPLSAQLSWQRVLHAVIEATIKVSLRSTGGE